MTRNPLPRNLLPLLGALALASFGPCMPIASAQVTGQIQPQQSQTQSSALVGTWSTTVNWNLPSGNLITTTFTSNGKIQSTIQNKMGMSYTVAGVYQFNAAQGSLSYEWQDYSPKQTCVDGECTPAQPPAPLGVVISASIKFLSATQFVFTANGVSATYVRTNAVGTPIP